MATIPWEITHSVETNARPAFAWRYWTNIAHWDDPPAEFELDGPFATGSRGTTRLPVTYNAAPGADFSKFETYKWVRIDGAEYPDQIPDGQIKQSIDSQLAAKGFTKTDSDTADLYVGYQVSISQE